MSDWYPHRVTPEPGKRYEWEPFIGPRFTATLEPEPWVDAEGRIRRP